MARYNDVVGQEAIVARLREFTEFFQSSGAIPGHILIIGESGMGKTFIADAIANEFGEILHKVNAADLMLDGDLTALTTNLREKQVLLISEINLFRRPLAERMQSALRDLKLKITIGKGAASRDHVMEIKPFTVVATCPRKADCPPNLLSEFSLILQLQPYSRTDLQAITSKIAAEAAIALDLRAAELIARSSSGRPSDVATTLRRLASAVNKTSITEEDVLKAFKAFGLAVPSELASQALAGIDKLSGIDFEVLIMGLLTRMGFQAEMTRTTGDGGIDIVARLDRPIVGGRYLFQCKRFRPENLVSAPTVRDFYGAVTADRAIKGVLITTSDFTAQAREFGEKAGIELIGSAQLEKLLMEYGIVQP